MRCVSTTWPKSSIYDHDPTQRTSLSIDLGVAARFAFDGMQKEQKGIPAPARTCSAFLRAVLRSLDGWDTNNRQKTQTTSGCAMASSERKFVSVTIERMVVYGSMLELIGFATDRRSNDGTMRAG